MINKNASIPVQKWLKNLVVTRFNINLALQVTLSKIIAIISIIIGAKNCL